MTLLAGQRSFDLDDLRLVSAVGEARSLAGGAKRLGVNHASAWRRLALLERRLGVRLFDRDRTGYTPTAAGEEGIEAARRVLDDLDRLERRLVGQDVRLNGTVRLTTTDTLVDLVAPALATLRQAHPGVLIELSTANGFLTLTRREADVALRPASAAGDGLVARRVATVATAVYGARDEATAATDPLRRPWLAPDDSLSHLAASRWIADHVPAERIVHRAGSLAALAAVARTGLGIVPLPCLMGDADPALVRILPPLPEMATSLWLITHPDLQRTARVRVVLEGLASSLARNRPLIEGRAPAP